MKHRCSRHVHTHTCHILTLLTLSLALTTAELPRHHRHVSDLPAPHLHRDSLDSRTQATDTVEFEIVVPPGVPAGRKIRVHAPNGQSVEVVIPQDTAPGHRMLIEVPADAPSHPNPKSQTPRSQTLNPSSATEDAEALAEAKNEAEAGAAVTAAAAEHKAATVAATVAAEKEDEAERGVSDALARRAKAEHEAQKALAHVKAEPASRVAAATYSEALVSMPSARLRPRRWLALDQRCI